MTTLFSDDFNRADSTSLGGSWSEVSGNWEIVTNAVREPTTVAAAAILINTSALGTADYAVESVITQGSVVSGSGRGMGLLARYQNSTNFYMGWINEFGSLYIIYRVSGGTFTDIGNWSTSALGDPVTLRLECQGTTIRLFVNGTSRVSVTDSTHSAAGNFGMRLFSGSLITDARYDSFLVTDFVAGGALGSRSTAGVGAAAGVLRALRTAGSRVSAGVASVVVGLRAWRVLGSRTSAGAATASGTLGVLAGGAVVSLGTRTSVGAAAGNAALVARRRLFAIAAAQSTTLGTLGILGKAPLSGGSVGRATTLGVLGLVAAPPAPIPPTPLAPRPVPPSLLPVYVVGAPAFGGVSVAVAPALGRTPSTSAPPLRPVLS